MLITFLFPSEGYLKAFFFLHRDADRHHREALQFEKLLNTSASKKITVGVDAAFERHLLARSSRISSIETTD